MLRRIIDFARPLVWRLSGLLAFAPRVWRWEILSRLATDMGLTAMAVQTKDGLFLMKVQDRTILPHIVKTRSNVGYSVLMDQFRQVLANGGTYLDIGANVGLTTIPLGSLSNITIHAFEPDPTNFRMLVANLSINCPGHQFSLHEIALGNENGMASFAINPRNAGDNRLAGSGRGAMGEDRWQRIQVPVRRLDHLIGEFNKPLVVKIDVQGAEAHVAAGARLTFENADVISVEWYPYALARAGGDPALIISLIAGFERASMLPHYLDHKLDWRSGKEIADRMNAVLAEGTNPYTSYDVLAIRGQT